MGGARQRRLDGTSFKPRKLPDCPQGVRTPSPRTARCAATTTPALHQTHDLPSKSGASVAPAHYAGVRVHYYPGDFPGRCVSAQTMPTASTVTQISCSNGVDGDTFSAMPNKYPTDPASAAAKRAVDDFRYSWYASSESVLTSWLRCSTTCAFTHCQC